jgi:hypothetical protein
MDKAKYAVVLAASVSDRVELQPHILIRRLSDGDLPHSSTFRLQLELQRMIGGEEFVIDDIIYGMAIDLQKLIPC